MGLDKVNFVEGQDHAFVSSLKLFYDQSFGFRVPGGDIDHQEYGVYIVHSTEGLVNDFLVEQGMGPVDAGGIDEYDLGSGCFDNPENPVPGGLGLFACDGYLLSEDGVEKGRFPGIGCADNGDKTGFKIVPTGDGFIDRLFP